ncbi:hypothetical protein AWH63_10605 [Marinobacter sp. C18]|uniref:hypothetical protein n=1 Tax=Marinobacter sp. C18 TaxID=1772288 RepID=UPI000948F337|nr:hypothetical protein [Marinobacter sp. C18]OLF81981.1 hypothetical protein AWH63_10605 [Marinobacter sp. C18]
MSGNPKVKMRGLQQNQEIQSQELYRDTRKTSKRIADGLADSWPTSAFIIVLLLPIAFISTTFFVLFVCPIIFWIISQVKGKDQKLPLLLPTEAKITDYRDAKPGRSGYHKARGEFFMGNMRASERAYEMWLAFAHLLTHTMLLGATGSGKTEALVSKAANYLAVGSGIMYSDAKAAPKLGWQLFTLARYFGREDDYRTLNYIKGNSSIKPDRAVRRGNNVNLFAYGNAESITQVLVSLMPPGGSENMLFSERAISLISSITPALVDLRDRANLKINPGVIRKALEFEEIEKLKRSKPITPESREAIRAYLTSLSGYKEQPTDRQGNPTDKQDSEVYRQHGFAQAYYTRALASLSDTYSDIYMVGRGEISFLDCILRRRIVTVMIPALEKAPDEMKNLAKIVLAAQKNAISTGIPPDIEGRKEDVIDSLPTTAPVPYGIINDEFAFMMTEGYGSVLAQARGLYTAVTIAGQDFAGMKRENADEAEQIAENTKLKIVMASEGLGETRKLIEEISGEGYAAITGGYNVDDGGMLGNYIDNKSASFERRSRVDVQDTRSVVEGEGIVFWRDTITPWQTFYHGIDEDSMIKDFLVHRLLDVDYPTRGPGAKYVMKDTPMAASMKKAVSDGLDLGLDQTVDIPEFSASAGNALSDARLDLALAGWRSVCGVVKNWKDNPFNLPPNSLVKSEGLLIAALSHELSDSNLYEEMDDDDEVIVSSKPLDNHHKHETSDLAESTAATVNTLAPPEESIGFMDSVDQDEIRNAVGSLDDPENALAILNSPRRSRKTASERQADKAAIVQAAMGGEAIGAQATHNEEVVATTDVDGHTGADIPTASGQSDTDRNAAPGDQVTPKLTGEPAKGSSLLDAAAWVMDPNILAERAERPVHQAEIDLAMRGGDYAGRIEQALGTSLEESRRVSEETAVAITKSVTYPRSDKSVPATLDSDAERELVIRDSNKTVSSMKMWLNSD